MLCKILSIIFGHPGHQVVSLPVRMNGNEIRRKMKSENINRGTFIKPATSTGAAAPSLHNSGKQGANQRLVAGIMGVNSRGHSVATGFASRPGCDLKWVCDVDERAVDRTVASVRENASSDTRLQARGTGDFRTILDDPDVDVLVIAACDHWHTPAAILAMKAGKHVYVEKPGSQNGHESELIVAAQKKYGKHVQMGNQQRSDPKSIQAIREIHDGILGRTYYAQAWYANTRGSIGTGQEASVPDWLDYELWQGPAPRRPYQDNLIHYNWHWFHHYGTGEIANNGTHELDVARWALGVTYPTRVQSSGGRYHYHDDWEFFDTQIASFDFEEAKSITWHGRSCNGHPFFDRGRGVTVHGEKGTMLIDRNGYLLYDKESNLVKEVTSDDVQDPLDTTGFDGNTVRHIQNFLDTIRGEATLNSSIESGQKPVTWCHLANIAQQLNRQLDVDPRTGRILGDDEAAALWKREYESGWEPTL